MNKNDNNSNGVVGLGLLLIVVAVFLFFSAPSSTNTSINYNFTSGGFDRESTNNPEYTTYMVGAGISGVIGVLLLFAGNNSENQKKSRILILQEHNRLENQKIEKLSENIEKQFQDIKNLFDKNIISEDEYKKLRDKIIEKN